MKWLNSYRLRWMLVGVVAAMVLGGGNAKADYIWTQKADMPIKKLQHSTSVVGGKIYSIGGWNTIGEWNPQWDALTRVDEYDPATDTWTRKADIPTARGYTSTCVVNKKIYVIGGDASGTGDGAGTVSIVEVYHPATDTWEEQTHLPSRRNEVCASVVDGIIYVFSGDLNNVEVRTVEAYDPTTDTWTRKADIPTARSDASSCVVDGKIYVIGGWSNWSKTATVEAYDPETDTWTVKAPMPTARYWLGASVVGGKIYAIGGWGHSINGPTYSTVEVYDPQTDTWTKGVDIPITTAGLSASVVGGKIYIFGGSTSTHRGEHWLLTSAVYEYDTGFIPRSPDINGDLIVDSADMRIMVDHWGENYPLCDIYPEPCGDGIVDVQDLILLAEHLFEDYRLVAHWKLDEAEGIVAGDSVGNNDGNVLGDPVWVPDGGQVGGAINLDGIDDVIIAGPVLNPVLRPFSVFAWILNGAPGQVIISQADVDGQSAIESGSTWLGINPSDGRLMTGLMDIFFGPLESESVVTNGQWHHVGLVYDSTAMKRHLYVDGAEVAVDQGIVAGVKSTAGLYIGAGQSLDAGTFFSGLIDDVRIYDLALSAEEIAALAQ